MIEKIRTLIVEDNEKDLSLLLKVLELYFPDVEIIGIAGNVAEGIQKMNELTPNLVLLDIELPDGEGFDILETIKCDFIVTTSFDKIEYCKKAYKMETIEFIEKPVYHAELREAIENFKSTKKGTRKPDKLPVRQGSSTTFIVYESIIWCKTNKRKVDVKIWDEFTREYELIETVETIGYFENELCGLNDKSFFMPNRSYIIDLERIKTYGRQMIIMCDGKQVPLSRDKKSKFEDKLKQIYGK